MDNLLDTEFDIIVGFKQRFRTYKLASKKLSDVLEALETMGATTIASYIPHPRDKGTVPALALIRLNGTGLTISDLRNKFGRGIYFERNASIAMSDYFSPDPLVSQQWALKILGVETPWPVRPPGGNAIAKTIVAIVDSGLRRPDGSVPEDIGSVEAVTDCQPVVNDPLGGVLILFPDGIDKKGHGTLLAGTIAAVPGNGTGIASAIPDDWNVRLMPIKFFFDSLDPHLGYAAMAIYHAAEFGAKVINASWHVALGAAGESESLRAAIQHATSKNCLVVAAAGNDGTDNEIYPTYPANFGHEPGTEDLQVLTVAATDSSDFKTSFSNYGQKYVDIAAPGLHIVSTGAYWTGAARYPSYSGTSAAAAFASSAAALVFALNPNWTPADVIQYLKDSSDKLASLKRICVDGNRLNIGRAVNGPLHITWPTRGETVHVGKPATICWANDFPSQKLNRIRIEFSVDDGVNWTELAASEDNSKAKCQWQWIPRKAHRTQRGQIRIAPIGGNFPSLSEKFVVQ